MSNIYLGLSRVFYVQVRGEEEWAAREEARRIEVEGLKAELEAVKRAAESGGIDGKYVCLPQTYEFILVFNKIFS